MCPRDREFAGVAGASEAHAGSLGDAYSDAGGPVKRDRIEGMVATFAAALVFAWAVAVTGILVGWWWE